MAIICGRQDLAWLSGPMVEGPRYGRQILEFARCPGHCGGIDSTVTRSIELLTLCVEGAHVEVQLEGQRRCTSPLATSYSPVGFPRELGGVCRYRDAAVTCLPLPSCWSRSAGLRRSGTLPQTTGSTKRFGPWSSRAPSWHALGAGR